MTKKKVKLRWGRVVVAIVLLLVVLFIILQYIFTIFKLESSSEINVNSDYEIKVSGIWLLKDISSDLKIKDDIDTSKLGKYKITVSYTTPLLIKKSKSFNVNVVDNEKPSIELNGGDSVSVILNSEYQELGYSTSDNYDEEVNVVITGNVDTSKVGTYYLTYKAKDRSNNTTEVVRKVIVEEKNPADVDIAEFDINDYFGTDVILPETDDYGDEYIDKIVFVGDSVPWQFGLNYQWDSNNVYAAPCTGPSNIYSQKVYWKNAITNKTIPDLIVQNKPEYILVSIGFCEIVSSGNVEQFISNYEKFIDDIKSSSPNTKIILNSMYPVISETLRGNEVPTNKQVNEYNYYIASIAKKYKVKYLDSASVLKASNGLADPSLTGDDGYHPNIAGMKKVINYIKSHGYK